MTIVRAQGLSQRQPTAGSERSDGRAPPQLTRTVPIPVSSGRSSWRRYSRAGP